MRYERLNEQGKKLKIKDIHATGKAGIPRTITQEEFVKIRPNQGFPRRIDFVFKNGLYQEISEDLAMFLVKKYEDVVVVSKNDEVLMKHDVLEHISHKDMMGLFPKIYKKYYAPKFKEEHLNMKSDQKRVFIRELMKDKNLDLNKVLKEVGVKIDGMEKTRS